MTVLLYVCYKEHEEMVSVLLAAGVDVNAVDEVSGFVLFVGRIMLMLQYGRTALMCACDDVLYGLASLLVCAGTDVDAVDDVSGIVLFVRGDC